ncbi:uncharacterized protein A4U43_C03F7030 [Asparagus officinalis]|uniref:Uncharacterized protein n=1 Tax=Asparagus officinalis TaxID=4686 RepID=A0A5P1F8J6_ASPOF|nr:uncharacterized protein A4U43_C03F7030 [Asparagus officinalis]
MAAVIMSLSRVPTSAMRLPPLPSTSPSRASPRAPVEGHVELHADGRERDTWRDAGDGEDEQEEVMSKRRMTKFTAAVVVHRQSLGIPSNSESNSGEDSADGSGSSDSGGDGDDDGGDGAGGNVPDT